MQAAKRAVITGDIIQSTQMRADERKVLVKAIAGTLKQLDKEYDMRSEMYRGDSFQCLVKNPANALRVALIIKTFIRSSNPSERGDLTKKTRTLYTVPMMFPVWIFDARIAVGIGKVDRVIKTLGTAGGEAFLLSGHLLDELKSTKQSFGIGTKDDQTQELQTEALLLDHIISRTTALQCEVIMWKLQNHTEMEIAKKLKIHQSAVNQRSNSAGWNAISAVIKRFEQIYEK
jgi:hypothetical protein